MRRSFASLLAVLAASLATFAVAQPAPPVQQTGGSALGVSIPLELREQFLGTSAGKTVVRFTLSFSRSDLREKAKGLAKSESYRIATRLAEESVRALSQGRAVRPDQLVLPAIPTRAERTKP